MTLTDSFTVTPAGLYCSAGDFYIDPHRPVDRALITHAHADHARAGHGAVLATQDTLDIMAIRYGPAFAGRTQAIALGAPLTIGEATISFHSAGHVLGSAQIAISAHGQRAVISGDYKRHRDPTCHPFELVPCDLFVTEATFGLPIFRHPPAEQEIDKLLASVHRFPERTHLVGAYSLGKAQRVIAVLREAGYDAPVYLHGAMVRLTEFYQMRGIPLGVTLPLQGEGRQALRGGIVLCPPSAVDDRWSRRFDDPVTAFASGWMRTRARARQRGVELPLIISDHGDWDELTSTILETGCSQLWVTHGQEDALVHWASTCGIDARPLRLIGYGDEEEAAA